MNPVEEVPVYVAVPLIIGLWLTVMYIYMIRPWRQEDKENRK